MPAPKAVIIALISLLPKILSSLAFSTFKILPRRGRIACVFRSLADLAEPPALSPSSMKISDRDGSFSEQSAHLPGREFDSMAVFLLAKSLAFLAASLALAACTDLLMMILAIRGFSSKK